MGLTQDARRDLRIRYVPPETEQDEAPAVAVMDRYRKMAATAGD
jgi:hypothetical protein